MAADPILTVILHEDGQDKDIHIDTKRSVGIQLAEHGFAELPCAGGGRCGKCKVVSPGLPESDEDKVFLTQAERDRGVRLACRIEAGSLVSGTRFERVNQRERMVALTDFGNLAVELDPVISKVTVMVTKATLDDPASDWTRLTRSLDFEATAPPHVLVELADTLAATEQVQLVMKKTGGDILAVRPADLPMPVLGLAVDIGTTTLAAYLYDLMTGEKIAAASAENPGRSFGSDVISRINMTMHDSDNTGRMQHLLAEGIASLARELLADHGFLAADIYDAVRVGNTTMLHFLLGLPTANIALSPFAPVFTEAWSVPARAIGFDYSGDIRLLPGLASYVGSDVMAGLLKIAGPGPTIYLDLGTNGEICLADDDEVIALATAAGPAFEGQNIACGMASVPGAIAELSLLPDVRVDTIGGGAPQGICGTGVLAAVAELLKAGIVDEGGRLQPAEECEEDVRRTFGPRLKQNDEGTYFDLGGAYFSARDVREVQLAKAAIRAGIEVLLREKNLTAGDIDQVLLAGGFGHYLNLSHAFRIGLLPDAVRGKVRSVGNGAGMGASMALLSRDAWLKVATLKARTRYVELSSRRDFAEAFMDHMGFGDDEL